MKPMNEEVLNKKVTGRATAKIHIEILNEGLERLGEEAKKTFWEDFGAWIDQNRPPMEWKELVKKQKQKDPMTDREARVFGEMRFWFGKHEGEFVGSQLLYLDYMVGKDSHFMDGQAVRFLKNDKVAEQLRILLENKE